MKILFITSDRLSPWNGKNANEPDHIWADLPQLLDCDLLICTLTNRKPNQIDYRFGPTTYTSTRRFDTLRAFTLFVLAFTKPEWRETDFRLGITWRQVISRWKRILLRQTWNSKDVFIWHKAVVLLTREFRNYRPDVVIFHNEFSPWGSAVVWASQRVGTPAVAHQHYAVSDDPGISPYNKVQELGRLLPEGLLCINSDQVERWRGLPIPVQLGGSRRGLWNINQSGGLSSCRAGKILFAPGLGDSAQLEDAILAFPQVFFYIKPHPGSKISWPFPNVEICYGEFSSVAEQFDVVITSSPSPIITLTNLRKPYVRVTSYDRVGTCRCSESVSFSTYLDVTEAIHSGRSIASMLSIGCEHNRVTLLPRAEYEARIMSILNSRKTS